MQRLSYAMVCAFVLATLAPPAQAQDAPCADATAQVQQYHAPGDALSVVEHLQQWLTRERRPVQVTGWLRASDNGAYCLTAWEVILGNESQAFFWRYWPATGEVDALDAATRRVSGW